MAYDDRGRSRYSGRDYPRDDDRDSYRDVERRPRRRRNRFDKYRVTGLLIMFFAVSILILGIFIIGWTTSRYGNNCQPDLSGYYPLLCSGNHVYVYISSPLWGGAWLIVVAFLSLGIHPDKERHATAHKHFIFLMGISLVLVIPVIIVLNVLEVYFGMNYYWMYDSDGNLISNDFVQFAIPIVIVILAGMVFNVILFFCVFIYCCRDEYNHHKSSSYDRERDYDPTEDSYRGRHWSHDPYRNYNRNRGNGFGGVYGGGGYGRRSFYN